MKKGSFAGLLYREFYLSRQSIVTGVIMFTGFALLGWLAVLSLDYGNLGKILTNLYTTGDGTITEEGMESFGLVRKNLFVSLKFYPTLMAMFLAMTPPDIAAKDTMTSWHRYLHCTPITPLRFAEVKTAVTAIFTAASFLISVVYMFLIGLASGEYLNYSDLSGVMLILLIITGFGVIGQIFILLLRSRDKGMLAAMGVIIVGVWAFAQSMGETGSDGFDTLVSAAEAVMPYSPLILAGMLALLFAAMYFIYKRREK